MLLSYYKAKLSLLLRLSQTRLGATHVLNAGLFQSIQESRLFSVDPDLGVDIDNPEALKKYYELLLAVIRVINSALLSRGAQNTQTIEQGRKFLQQNRQSVVAIFKRDAKVGTVRDKTSDDLADLVDALILMITTTGFLDVSGQLRIINFLY